MGQLRRKHLPPSFQLFTAQAWLAVAVEVIAQIWMHEYPNRSNHLVYNIYMPFDFILLFLAGYDYLERRTKLVNWIGIGAYLVVWVASLSIQGIHKMANFSIICGAIILTIRYIQVLIWNAKQPSGALTTGIYFVAVAILVYYCCMIPLFSLMHYFIRENLELAARIFYVNNGLAALRYIGAGIGLLIASKAFDPKSAMHV